MLSFATPNHWKTKPLSSRSAIFRLIWCCRERRCSDSSPACAPQTGHTSCWRLEFAGRCSVLHLMISFPLVCKFCKYFKSLISATFRNWDRAAAGARSSNFKLCERSQGLPKSWRAQRPAAYSPQTEPSTASLLPGLFLLGPAS